MEEMHAWFMFYLDELKYYHSTLPKDSREYKLVELIINNHIDTVILYEHTEHYKQRHPDVIE